MRTNRVHSGTVEKASGPSPPLVDRESILHGAKTMATTLGDVSYVINACEDFRCFVTAFLAALMANKVSLFPGDHTTKHLEYLESQYQGCKLITDIGVPEKTNHATAPSAQTGQELEQILDRIPGSRRVLIAFTSGSTGNPLAVSKSWAGLVAGGQSLKRALPKAFVASKYSVFSTVPPQHSYGIETSLMPALMGMARVFSKRGHFPAEISQGLASLAGPRCFVTTPLHIRALLDTRLELPPVELTVCATAPLDQAMAMRFEKRFATKILEIYGCTESGFVATRWTTKDSAWALRDDMSLRSEGERTFVQAAFLKEDVQLDDIIAIRGERHFDLIGRSSDMVKVGGKRASLEGLRQVLLRMDGVEDCKFILQPQSSKAMTPRTAVFVVGDGCKREKIKEFLRRHVDPVLVPRQVVVLDALPRNAVGKVSMEHLRKIATAKTGK